MGFRLTNMLPVLIIVAAVIALSPCALGAVSNLTVGVADELPAKDGDAFVMVQGTFHTVQFDVGSSNAITVVIHEGSSPPATRNVTNYYEFEYTPGGGFKDKAYGTFIDPVRCSRSAGSAKFFVAVDPSVNIGGWTIRIDVDGSPDASSAISMRQITVGLALSQPVFVFRVDPFTPKNSTSEQSFRTVNEGNVPVTYSIRYDKLASLISISSMDGLVHRGETRYHTVKATIPKYSPQKIDITGTLRAEVPKEVLKLTGTVTLQTSIEQTIGIRLVIAHPGYDVLNLGNGKVVVQYETTRIIKYGDLLTLITYYTGKASATLSYTVSDLEVKGTRFNWNDSKPPLTISLSELSEQTVEVAVTPVKDDVTAKVRYHIESSDGAVKYDFETRVVVSASSAPRQGNPDEMSLAGFVFVIGIVVFVIALIIKGRRDTAKASKNTKRRKRPSGAAPKVSQVSGKRTVPKTKRKLDPRKQRKLDRRRRRWLESHERKVRRRAMKR